jgi:hypothetical protein
MTLVSGASGNTFLSGNYWLTTTTYYLDLSVSGSQTFQVTNTSTNYWNMVVLVYDDVASGAPEADEYAGSAGLGALTSFTDDITTVSDGAIVVGSLGVSDFAAGHSFDADNSQTEREDDPGNNMVSIVAGDIVVASAGTQTFGWSESGSVAYDVQGQALISLEAATGDVTAPNLSSPTATKTGATTASGSVDTDEGNGTLYWVCTESGTAPSVAQIQAGQDNGGSAAADDGSQAVSGTGTQNISVTGLNPSTTYYIHYQQQDAATNDSTVVSSSSFTTDSDTPAGQLVTTKLHDIQ